MRYRFAAINIILHFLLSNILLAGVQPVSIYVKDQERLPLPGATIQLTKLNDGNTIFSTTDHTGVARFHSLDNTYYFVQIRYLGFMTLERQIHITPDTREFEFQMTEDAISLGGVTVSGRRPLMRQEEDRLIIDPEPLANISSSILEVLESTPGLFVDPDGGIFLGSTRPAAIYINGREQKMSSQDINTILRSLPPGSVERIEIMRTPSTRFDAASSGGIVNIVLKKGYQVGRFGTINAGMNQGKQGNQFGGFSYNNSGDRATGYVNANFSRNASMNEFSSLRLTSQTRSLSQQAESTQKRNQAYLGFGISYDPREWMVISYDSRINLSGSKSGSDNLSLITEAPDLIISENINAVNNQGRFFNISQDFGVTIKLDSMGSVWETKAGFSHNQNTSFQDYQTSFVLPQQFILAGEGDSEQSRSFMMLQSDLTYRILPRMTFETGWKSTFQQYDSQSAYFIQANESLIEDPRRTNAFRYDERIHSLYIQTSVPLPGKLVLKTGVRLENTQMEGRQTIPGDTSFVTNRTDWFPYVYMSRKLFEVANHELRAFMIYRRTIGRPGYQSLNPYIRYVDQYLYETGNPSLKPQYTDTYEANISVDNTPVFALGRKYTRNIFSSVTYQDPLQEHVAVRTYDNVGKNMETYFRVTAAIPPGRRYFFVAGAQYNRNHYEGVYEDTPLSFNRGSWMFFTFHSLRITSQTRLTITGFMMHKGQQNFYELDSFGQLNIGLNQSLFDNRLQVSLSGRDIFRTMATSFNMNQGSIPMSGQRYGDTQRFGVNIRYRLGIRNL